MTTTHKALSSSRPAPAAWIIGAVVAVQILCTGFFAYGFLIDVVGIAGEPISWRAHELIELGVILALILGLAIGTFTFSQTLRRAQAAEVRLEELSGAFHQLVEARFTGWQLTPAERDVAYFLLKGFSTAEIAGLRNTSEGTIKSQTAAIYRKAEVTGRGQLVSIFFDDLLDDQLRLPTPSPNRLPSPEPVQT